MSTRIHRRRGFTLVEMLVVISIVVILMGLLIPAVSAVRARTRTTKCAHQMHEMAQAVGAFEDARGRYPGSRELIAKRGVGVGQNKSATWQVMLLPYLGQQPLFDLWDDPTVSIYQVPASGAPPYAERLIPSLSEYRCPSDTSLQDSDPLLNGIPPETSYVGNGGFFPLIGTDPAPYNSPAAYLQVMNRHNGVFHDLVRKPKARFTTDMLYDGAGNTIMLSENMQAQWWCYTGDVNQIGATPHLNRLSTMMYYLYTASPQLSPNQPAPTMTVMDEMRINHQRRTAPLRPTTARPSSEHEGGVNVAFCDGSVRFVREGIAYHVYISLMTPRDKKADVPWQEFVVKAEDYLTN